MFDLLKYINIVSFNFYCIQLLDDNTINNFPCKIFNIKPMRIEDILDHSYL